jgi:hypothetical protein
MYMYNLEKIIADSILCELNCEGETKKKHLGFTLGDLGDKDD